MIHAVRSDMEPANEDPSKNTNESEGSGRVVF
jgi:hypothetical protein